MKVSPDPNFTLDYDWHNDTGSLTRCVICNGLHKGTSDVCGLCSYSIREDLSTDEEEEVVEEDEDE